MFSEIGSFWVYLSASPLLGLTLTLCAYVVAHAIFTRCNYSPLANPVAISIVLISVVLAGSGMSYQRYFAGAQFVHFLLGPATVALAVPLARQFPRMRRALRGIAVLRQRAGQGLGGEFVAEACQVAVLGLGHGVSFCYWFHSTG